MPVRESIFTIEADQWSEHGYIYRDGQVMQYETDRKEQTHMEFGGCRLEDFIAKVDIASEVREWARQILEERSGFTR